VILVPNESYLSIAEVAERACAELRVPESVAEYLVPNSRSITPELRLMAAILDSAIAERDIDWVLRGDESWPFSFRRIAEALNRRDSRFIDEVVALMRSPKRHIQRIHRGPRMSMGRIRTAA